MSLSGRGEACCCGTSTGRVEGEGEGPWEVEAAWGGVGRVEVREGGRWCLEDSLPMMLESECWLRESSRRDRVVLARLMERARVCDGLCATVAWA